MSVCGCGGGASVGGGVCEEVYSVCTCTLRILVSSCVSVCVCGGVRLCEEVCVRKCIQFVHVHYVSLSALVCVGVWGGGCVCVGKCV